VSPHLETVQIVSIRTSAGRRPARGERNRTVPAGARKRCGNISELELLAFEERDRKGYAGRATHDESHLWEARRHGRQNSSGDVRLYNFAPPDKKSRSVVLTRPSALPISRLSSWRHHLPIRGVALRGRPHEEDGMKAPARSICTTRSPCPQAVELGARVGQSIPMCHRMRSAPRLRFSLGCDQGHSSPTRRSTRQVDTLHLSRVMETVMVVVTGVSP